MPYTKLQTLEAFCLDRDYDLTKLEGETKQEFLKRKQKEWSLSIAKNYLKSQKNLTSEQEFQEETLGLDI